MSVGVTVALPGAGDNGAHYPSAYTGQSVAEAVYQTVHGYRGGVGGVQAVAELLGRSANTLTHKVNPHATTNHVLGLEEALRIAEVTGNMALVHAICARFGGVFVPSVPMAEEPSQTQVLKTVGTAFGDFLHALCDAVHANGQASRNEHRRVVYQAQLTQSAVAHGVAWVASCVRNGEESA